MTTSQSQFKIRLPEQLRQRLEEAAGTSGKSMTAEIVDRLVKSFDAVETVMLANRFLELRLIEREIGSQEQHLKELAAADAAEIDYHDAREALVFLRAHKNLITHHIQELTTAIEPPESEAKKREVAPRRPVKKAKK